MARDDALIRQLSSDYQRQYDPAFAWKSSCSQYRALTGLRGLWPMSLFDENGDALDASGQGKTLTATTLYAVIPLYGYDSLAPYVELAALGEVGNWLERADEAALDITGTETYVIEDQRGITMGGWFYTQDVTNWQGLIAKRPFAAGQISYSLELRGDVAGDPARFLISDDGTNFSESVSTNGYVDNTWHFIAGRWNEADVNWEVVVWIDGVKTATPSNRASIHAGTADFCIGAIDGGNQAFTGRASMCFLCAAALSDALVMSVYHQTRAMYGR